MAHRNHHKDEGPEEKVQVIDSFTEEYEVAMAQRITKRLLLKKRMRFLKSVKPIMKLSLRTLAKMLVWMLKTKTFLTTMTTTATSKSGSWW